MTFSLHPLIFSLTFLFLMHEWVANSLQIPPIWIPSPYIRADQNNLINYKKTGNSSKPTATLTFPTPFTSVPNLAYGIMGYQGQDAMGSQCWQILRTGLTSTSFSVSIQIKGYTNLWLLIIRYIGIDRTFPHHLNSFDNVPVNYSKGPITNISSKSPTPQYYINTINYTKQASDNNYKYRTFTGPFSNYRILLFMTSMFQFGSNQPKSSTTKNPLNLRITTTIKTSSTYMINASYGVKAQINRLHFSMVIFDQVNVQASGLYQLVYQRIDLPKTGGFIPIPQSLVPSLIIGYCEFSTVQTMSYLHFKLSFITVFGIHGIYMPLSVPRQSAVPYSRFAFTLFYMKTWICTNDTYMNLTSDMCQSCTIPNCMICQHLKLCQTCNANYSLNALAVPSLQCIYCPIANCLTCSANYTECLECDTVNNYFINPSLTCSACTIPYCITCGSLSTCTQCNQSANYFANPAPTSLNDICTPCIIPNCAQCASLLLCSLCDQVNGYFFNSSYTSQYDQCMLCDIGNCTQCDSLTLCSRCDQANGFTLNPTAIPQQQCIPCPVPFCSRCLNFTYCQQCDQVNNYFPNTDLTSPIQCVLCTIPFCRTCQTLLTCTQCDIALNYIDNPAPLGTNDLCVLCPLTQCIRCANYTTCSICNETRNFFVDPSTLLCIPCQLIECVQCANLTDCQICNETNRYFLNYTSNLCQYCDLTQCVQCLTLTTCLLCNSSNMYFVNAANRLCYQPGPVCGDLIWLPWEGCDDGNTINGDGCSDSCSIQQDFICEHNTAYAMFDSVCYYVGEIVFQLVYIEKLDGVNQVQILFEIGPPQLAFWDYIDFSLILLMDGNSILGAAIDKFEVHNNADGTLTMNIGYHSDIHNTLADIQVVFNNSGIVGLSKQPQLLWSFPVVPNDNELAVCYSQQDYNMAQYTQYAAYGVAGLSLLVFLIGIAAGKLIGVEMMAVIQISYLGLLSLQSLTPFFNAIAHVWFVNGYNYFTLSKSYLLDTLIPIQIKGIYLQSRLVFNYNAMLLLIILSYIIAFIVYIVAKICCKSQQSQKQEKVKQQNMENKQSQQEQSRQQKLIKVSKTIAAQYGFNFVAFSAYIVSVSLALQFLYGIKSMSDMLGYASIGLAGALILIYVVNFIMIIMAPLHFGQFTNYFRKFNKQEDKEKQKKYKKQQSLGSRISMNIRYKWYNWLLIQRFIIGFILVTQYHSKTALIVPIAIYIVLSIITFTLRPYLKPRHNVRFVLNMAITATVLFVYFFYNQAQPSARNKGIWVYMPLGICGLLLLCAMYSLVFMIYELVMGKKEKQIEQNRKIIDQEWKQINKASPRNQDSPTLASSLVSSPISVKPASVNAADQLKEVRREVKNEFSTNSGINTRRNLKKAILDPNQSAELAIGQQYAGI